MEKARLCLSLCSLTIWVGISFRTTLPVATLQLVPDRIFPMVLVPAPIITTEPTLWLAIFEATKRRKIA